MSHVTRQEGSSRKNQWGGIPPRNTVSTGTSPRYRTQAAQLCDTAPADRAVLQASHVTRQRNGSMYTPVTVVRLPQAIIPRWSGGRCKHAQSSEPQPRPMHSLQALLSEALTQTSRQSARAPQTLVAPLAKPKGERRKTQNTIWCPVPHRQDWRAVCRPPAAC